MWLLLTTFLACNSLFGACRSQWAIAITTDNTITLEAFVINCFLGTYLIAVFVLYTRFSTYIHVLLFVKDVSSCVSTTASSPEGWIWGILLYSFQLVLKCQTLLNNRRDTNICVLCFLRLPQWCLLVYRWTKESSGTGYTDISGRREDDCGSASGRVWSVPLLLCRQPTKSSPL